jgi:tetratricopeptide (TPR) repeat protein
VAANLSTVSIIVSMRRTVAGTFAALAVYGWCMGTGQTEFAYASDAHEHAVADSGSWDKFDREVKAKFEDPALEARQKGDFTTEDSLYKAAAAQWKTRHYEDAVVQENCNLRMIQNLFNAAYAEKRVGRYDLAAETYLQCNEIAILRRNGSYHPEIYKDPAGYLPNVAEAYKDGKQFDKAEKIYADLIKLEDRENAWRYGLALAKVFEAAGELKRAEETTEDLVKEGLNSKSPQETRSARVYLRTIFQSQNRPDAVATIDHALNDKHCPVCGSDKEVQRIVYGDPPTLLPWVPNLPQGHTIQKGAIPDQPSESSQTEVSREPDVKLGGGMNDSGSPVWYCPKDDTCF